MCGICYNLQAALAACKRTLILLVLVYSLNEDLYMDVHDYDNGNGIDDYDVKGKNGDRLANQLFWFALERFKFQQVLTI